MTKVNVGKLTSFLVGSDEPTPVRLLGEALPRSEEFKRLRAGTRLGRWRYTGPVLEGRIDKVQSMLTQMPHLPTFHCRSTVAGALVLSTALHGVALAAAAERTLTTLESKVVRAIWGAAVLARAKEVIFTLLSPGHRTAPHMRVKYDQLTWLTRTVREPGPTQVMVQAIWEDRERPPLTGPAGRALRVPAQRGWQPLEGWWQWGVPG